MKNKIKFVFIGFLGLLIGIILTPVVMNVSSAIINDSHISDFTGLAAIAAIIPIIWLGKVIYDSWSESKNG